MEPVGVAEMYGEWELTADEVEAELQRSLGPRSSQSLFDTVESLALPEDPVVLDIGARDGRHSSTLHRLLGCKVVAVDPIETHVEAATRHFEAEGLAASLEARRGTIEEIPAEPGTFDLIFCRDVLSHVEDLDAALRECARVTAPGGWMVNYQTFATGWLEPGERTRLCAGLAVVPESLEAGGFERAAVGAGFEIESVDHVGSEWREAWEEDGTGRTSRQLLTAARLIRDEDGLRSRLGHTAYRVELFNALWGVYQMVGKLEPRVYVLSR